MHVNHDSNRCAPVILHVRLFVFPFSASLAFLPPQATADECVNIRCWHLCGAICVCICLHYLKYTITQIKADAPARAFKMKMAKCMNDGVLIHVCVALWRGNRGGGAVDCSFSHWKGGGACKAKREILWEISRAASMSSSRLLFKWCC